jgi:hypothetical protein
MIWALAALQAAVTIAWMAYGYFQPTLLAHFGFASLAAALSWYLVFAGSTLAPVAGAFADRIVRRGGNRFPVIGAGVALAAASFVAVAITASATPGSARAAALPFLVAIWIAGMTIFQAPALSLLTQGGAAVDVSAAMAPLVVATTLPNALWPWVVAMLDRLGPSASFLAGGTAVTLTALALGRTARVAPTPLPASPVGGPSSGAATASLRDHGMSPIVLFACGIASAVVVLLALDLTPQALAARVASVSATTLVAVVGIASALLAPLAARLGGSIGSRTALLAGLVVALVCRMIVPACASEVAAYALAAILGAALALHLATALPFALSSQPAAHAGLAAGLYVGGAMAGSQIGRLLALPVALGLPLASGAVAEPKDIIGTEKKVYSQHDEELIIRDFFQDRRDGFFVDAGCAYPRKYSTTFYLEERLGWTGIGIDALASYGPAWAKERPKSKFFAFLVTGHTTAENTFFESSYRPLSSIHKDIAGPTGKEIKVPSTTLNDLLERNGVKKIDFLSMDIEGAQLAALSAFDIDKYKPELICMEQWPPDQKALLEYFKTHKYKWITQYLRHDWVNWYFAPEDHPRLPEIAKREAARPPKVRPSAAAAP